MSAMTASDPEQDNLEVLFSAAEIEDRVNRLADDIAQDIGPDIAVVAILKGSFVFTADLLRALHHCGVRPRIDFMTLSSYGSGTESKGRVEIVRDVVDDLSGQPVLLIDDILESGRTLAFAKAHLLGLGAQAVRVCVLLDKPGKRATEIEADYVGFVSPDRFVVGYGLDHAHYYRELPYIGVLERT
jgi:hypoxanthine phosphoribosyltransferase